MAERDVGTSAVGWIETALRRFWSRLGSALDSLGGRGASGGADMARLVPLLERAIEDRLRREGDGFLAPNLIDVRFDYETFAALNTQQRDYLSRELRTNAAEYIHNRRYTPAGAIELRLDFDPFTKRALIRASFPGEKSAAEFGDQKSKPESASTPRITGGIELRVRVASARRQSEMRARLAPGGTPVGLGRSHDNALIVDDGSVSNFHASFTCASDGAVAVADLDSSNGTLVNGEPLPAGERRRIRSGDRVRCGDVEMTIEIAE